MTLFENYKKINIASGSMCLVDFFNVDWPVGHLDNIKEKKISDGVIYRTPDAYMDATNLHEIPDNYFEYVRSSHALEHFCVSQTRSILKEWVRILKKGGIIDIVVPDFDEIIRRYYDNTGKWDEWWEETKKDRGLWWDTPEREPLRTKEMALMQLLYLNGHHKTFFNFSHLSSLLSEHGIVDIKRYDNEIMDTAVCNYSLCVKGIKN